MDTSIITGVTESSLTLDTTAVKGSSQYEAWCNCWSDLISQHIGCFDLSRKIPIDSSFTGRLWSLELGELIWFCTYHSPLTTYLTRTNIKKQVVPSYILLIPLNPRHLQQKHQDLMIQNDQMLLMSQSYPAVSDSLVEQYTIGLVIPEKFISVHIKDMLKKQMLIINSIQGFAYALKTLLLILPRSVEGEHSRSQRKEFSDQILNLLHLSFNHKPIKESYIPSIHYFKAAMTIIERHLHEPGLSCRFIAFQLGISESYLYKIFQQNKFRINDEIQRKRIEKVSEALRAEQYSKYKISQLAYHFGFSSPSHFNHVFRKYFLCSPSAYRQNNQESKNIQI